MRKAMFGLVALVLLGGCAQYTERTSPCVCLWEPINSAQEEEIIV